MYPGERFNSITHLVGSVLALIGTSVAVTLAAQRGGATRIVAVSIYCAMLVVLYLSSTLYHSLRGKAKKLFHVFDHCSIYLLIAGTYTPVGLLSLHGALQRVVLAVVWGGAAAAILTKVLWVHSPKSLSVVFGIALGWVGIAAMPQLAHTAGPAAVALLGAGGIAYTAGAVVYALRRPALAPAIFGYHELFHALTLVALACQYVAIAFFVVRVG